MWSVDVGGATSAPISSCETIAGVRAVQLDAGRDPRGALTEIFRSSWLPDPVPLQWNLLRSVPNALRGVHVHIHHTDYVCAVDATLRVGLKDLRRGSQTWLKDAHYALGPTDLLCIPPGVAHGFHAPQESLFLVGASAYFDPADDLGYRWDDPAGLLFPEVRDPVLSERDRSAETLSELLRALEPHQARLAC